MNSKRKLLMMRARVQVSREAELGQSQKLLAGCEKRQGTWLMPNDSKSNMRTSSDRHISQAILQQFD
jgi:hypothetical protein